MGTHDEDTPRHLRPTIAEDGRRAADAPADDDAGATMPSRVGAYRVRELLAQGGMGVVYIAEQENPSRTVALKIIRPGQATPELLRRFENEAHVLGLLQHPGIAQIYEAGTADTGHGPQPFFAMELVRGKDLIEYADASDLDTRARLRLLARVCDAVAHAHQRGIIHRDLKPANILVTTEGQPKVLDFGVARATDADVKATVYTYAGQLIGTLPYMSPEQIAGDPDDVDTRCDIYALGVMLHELLTGTLPYEVAGKSFMDVARTIQDTQPASLSTVNRIYRGDIETIVGKALEKDKDRRYETAQALADDIRRYLAHEPIVARPPSTWYQAQKFTRRHRALVLSAGLGVLALVVGLAAATWGYMSAQRERFRAEAINDYLLEKVLQAPNPIHGGPNTKVIDVIDRAAEAVEKEFADQPLLRADLWSTLSATYRGLGQYETAEELGRKAYEIRLAALGEMHPDTIEALDRIGHAQIGQGRPDEAVEYLSLVVDQRSRVLGPMHPETLRTKSDLAEAYDHTGDHERGIAMQREVVETRRRIMGRDNIDTIRSTISLASMLNFYGELEEAQGLYNEALELSSEAGESAVTATIASLNGLSYLYRSLGDDAASADYAERSLDASIELYGANHPDVGVAMTNLANALNRLGRDEEAANLRRGVLAIFEESLGPEHEWTLTARHNLAGSIANLGDKEEAERMHLRNLEDRRRVLGERSMGVAETLGGLGIVYNNTDRYEEAVVALEEALEIYLALFDEDHPEVATTLSNLAHSYQNTGAYERAAEVSRKLIDVDTRTVGPTHPWVMADYRDLIMALIAAGDPAGAEQAARQRLERAEDLQQDDPNRAESSALLGHALAKQGRYAEAEGLLLQAHATLLEVDEDNTDRTEDTADYLTELYEAWGKPERAAAYRRTAASSGGDR